MKQEMFNWCIGVGLFAFIATIIYSVGVTYFPYNHFTWLECWGLVMLAITMKSGIDSYNESNDEE